MKPHPALAVPLVNAGRRQCALRNARGKSELQKAFFSTSSELSQGFGGTGKE